MEWPKDASLALIERYRDQPVLWHNRHSHYHSRTRKQEAWVAIARGMGLGTDEVRQKMNSLLGSFRRERSKLRRGEGKDALGNAASHWFAFDKMAFLLARHEDLSSDQVYLEDFETKLDDEDDDLGLDSDSNLLEEELNDASCKVPRKRAEDSFTFHRSSAKKTNIRHQRGATSGELIRNECVAFGQYVATKLMRMDSRTRAFVQHSISNVLFEAEMGKYDGMQPQFDGDAQTSAFFSSSCMDGMDLLTSSPGNSKVDQLALVPDVAEAAVET